MIEIVPTSSGVSVRVHAQPRASRDILLGEHNGALKIAVTAPPADGKANAAIVKLLAKSFGVPKSAVKLIAGHSSRDKRVAIDGISVDQASSLLANL